LSLSGLWPSATASPSGKSDAFLNAACSPSPRASARTASSPLTSCRKSRPHCAPPATFGRRRWPMPIDSACAHDLLAELRRRAQAGDRAASWLLRLLLQGERAQVVRDREQQAEAERIAM